jgi:phosphate-selective porin
MSNAPQRPSERGVRIALAALVALACGVWPASAQVKLTFDKRPSIAVRDVFSMDFRVKSQMDVRDFPVEPATDSKGVFDLHRARVGIDGNFMQKRFDYQVEWELSDTTGPWRDAYLDARVLPFLEVRGGQFKIPFGLDQLTSSMDLDFNYRSLAGSYLAPGRDLGVMAHGHLLNDVLRFQAGVFRRGGDNVRASERSDPQTNRTYAGRVVVKPWDGSSHRALRSLAAGVAFTDGELPAGPNGLRGKTIPGDAFFQRLYVNGRRQRIGAELQWRPGSFGVQGELMRARDQRFGQGVDNEDLADVFANGWYVSTTWLVTGERKKDSVAPERPFLQGSLGAIELAGRVERLASSNEGSNPVLSDSPRSPFVLPRADDVWTAGVNWYLNDYVKLQANLIREQRLVNGTVIPGETHLWSRTLRIQFGF